MAETQLNVCSFFQLESKKHSQCTYMYCKTCPLNLNKKLETSIQKQTVAAKLIHVTKLNACMHLFTVLLLK